MLISFEGIDGCGKSTQISMLSDWLRERGVGHHLFREPGGTELSEAVRELLLHASREMDPVTELLLFSSARSQLVTEKLIPLLERNELVVLDRFYDSTVAYQGYGRGSASPEEIDRLNRLASHGVVPDCTFYLRIPVELARERRSGLAEDRMEKERDAFFDRVASGFEALALREERFVVLDAVRPAEEIFREVAGHLERLGIAG